MKYTTTLLLLLGTLLQGACSNQAVYTGESFASDSPFRMRAEGEVGLACESARRALLGQGYLIDSAGAESVKGRKAYRTEDTQNTFIEMTVVCLGDYSGSTLYATGVLSRYELKKSSSSASVGLSALGSISLPIGQSADSLVKVSEETIDDKDFYKRFFSAVDIILGEILAAKESTEPLSADSVSPEPASAAASAPAPAPEAAAVPEAVAVPVAPPAQPASASLPVAPAAAPETAPASVAPTPVPAPAPGAPAAASLPAQGTPSPPESTPTTPAAPQDVVPLQSSPEALSSAVTTQPAASPDIAPESATAVQPEPAVPVSPAQPDPAATAPAVTTELEYIAVPRGIP